MPYGLPWSEEFVRQLACKAVRDEFVADQMRSRIALLIRALRDDRGLSQAALGDLMGKPQSVVSRLEDPDYGKASIQTLLEVAAAFDLPLMIDMPSWDDWFRSIKKVKGSDVVNEAFDIDRLMGSANNARSCAESGDIKQISIGSRIKTSSVLPYVQRSVVNA